MYAKTPHYFSIGTTVVISATKPKDTVATYSKLPLHICKETNGLNSYSYGTKGCPKHVRESHMSICIAMGYSIHVYMKQYKYVSCTTFTWILAIYAFEKNE